MDIFQKHNQIVERKVADHDGTEYAVGLRRLNTADIAYVSDQMVVAQGAEGDEELRPMLGRRRILMLQRAIVTWTLSPEPPSEALIDQLPPHISEQIYEALEEIQDYTAEPEPVAEKAPDPTNGSNGTSDDKSIGLSAVAG